MRSHWRHLLGALAAILLLCGAAGAQEIRITMKNGAVFAGLLVKETDAHIDLELGNGRIRLRKQWILTRSHPRPPSNPGTGSGTGRPAQGTAGPKPGNAHPRLTGTPEVKGPAGTPFPWAGPAAGGLRPNPLLGSKAGNTASSLENAPLPLGTPEHCVASFLRLVGAGHSEAAVDRCVNVDRVLNEFFPTHTPALTRYSRKRAARSWGRILRMIFADPKLMAAVRDDRIQVRTVRESGAKSLVEVAFPPSDNPAGESEIYLLGVEGNRIVDFGNMLWTLKKVCEELSTQLRTAGSWVLVPLLDQTADRILSARRGSGGSLDKLTLPSVRDLRETQVRHPGIAGELIVQPMSNYKINLPPTWKQMEGDRLPRYADILLHDRTRKAFAMVLVETSGMALTALERATRANLAQVAEDMEITERRMVIVPIGEAVRFTAKATVDGMPLVYRYHLATTRNHSYQVICWTSAAHEAKYSSALQQLIGSFEVLKSDRVTKEPTGASRTDPGQGQTRPPKANGETTKEEDGALKTRLLKLLGIKDAKKPPKKGETGND